MADKLAGAPGNYKTKSEMLVFTGMNHYTSQTVGHQLPKPTLRPQKIGPKDNGKVGRGHLVHERLRSDLDQKSHNEFENAVVFFR